MTDVPFFVYGTLLPDQPNFRLWGDSISRMEYFAGDKNLSNPTGNGIIWNRPKPTDANMLKSKGL